VRTRRGFLARFLPIENLSVDLFGNSTKTPRRERGERSRLILTTEAQMNRKLLTFGLSSLTAVAMFSSSLVPAQVFHVD
jgi:hypothetical protein